MAESGTLLRCYTRKGIGGSNPPLSAVHSSGCSVARLSRLLWEQEVAGSNPATPTLTLLIHFFRYLSNVFIVHLPAY